MFDPKCFDLAEAFLSEQTHQPEDVNELAQQIQGTIEAFIASLEDVKDVQ